MKLFSYSCALLFVLVFPSFFIPKDQLSLSCPKELISRSASESSTTSHFKNRLLNITPAEKPNHFYFIPLNDKLSDKEIKFDQEATNRIENELGKITNQLKAKAGDLNLFIITGYYGKNRSEAILDPSSADPKKPIKIVGRYGPGFSTLQVAAEKIEAILPNNKPSITVIIGLAQSQVSSTINDQFIIDNWQIKLNQIHTNTQFFNEKKNSIEALLHTYGQKPFGTKVETEKKFEEFITKLNETLTGDEQYVQLLHTFSDIEMQNLPWYKQIKTQLLTTPKPVTKFDPTIGKVLDFSGILTTEEKLQLENGLEAIKKEGLVYQITINDYRPENHIQQAGFNYDPIAATKEDIRELRLFFNKAGMTFEFVGGKVKNFLCGPITVKQWVTQKQFNHPNNLFYQFVNELVKLDAWLAKSRQEDKTGEMLTKTLSIPEWWYNPDHVRFNPAIGKFMELTNLYSINVPERKQFIEFLTSTIVGDYDSKKYNDVLIDLAFIAGFTNGATGLVTGINSAPDQTIDLAKFLSELVCDAEKRARFWEEIKKLNNLRKSQGPIKGIITVPLKLHQSYTQKRNPCLQAYDAGSALWAVFLITKVMTTPKQWISTLDWLTQEPQLIEKTTGLAALADLAGSYNPYNMFIGKLLSPIDKYQRFVWKVGGQPISGVWDCKKYLITFGAEDQKGMIMLVAKKGIENTITPVKRGGEAWQSWDWTMIPPVTFQYFLLMNGNRIRGVELDRDGDFMTGENRKEKVIVDYYKYPDGEPVRLYDGSMLLEAKDPYTQDYSLVIAPVETTEGQIIVPVSLKNSLYGGNTIHTVSTRTTTLLGDYHDGLKYVIDNESFKNNGIYKMGENPGGLNVLTGGKLGVYKNQVTPAIITKWLEEAIGRGDIFRVVSDPNNPDNAVLKQEIEILKAYGYGFDPNTHEYLKQQLNKFERKTIPMPPGESLFGGNETRIAAGKTTTVLGRERERQYIIESNNGKMGANPGGLNVLTIPDNNVTKELVEKWLGAAMQRGDIFRVVTDPSKPANIWEGDPIGSKPMHLTPFGLQIYTVLNAGYTLNDITKEYVKKEATNPYTEILIPVPPGESLFGGNETRIAAGKTTTVLGRERERQYIIESNNGKMGANPGGLNVLTIPDNNVTKELVEKWLGAAMQRGDIFRVVTDPSKPANIWEDGRVGETLTPLGLQIKKLKEGGYLYDEVTKGFIKKTSPVKGIKVVLTPPGKFLFGGNEIKVNSNTTTAIIGVYKEAKQYIIAAGDYDIGANPGGLNLLNKKDEEIRKEEVDHWLQEAMDRGDVFRVISNPDDPANIWVGGFSNGSIGPLTPFSYQLKALIERGYIYNKDTYEFVKDPKFTGNIKAIPVADAKLLGGNSIPVVNGVTTTILGGKTDLRYIIATGDFKTGANPGGLNVLVDYVDIVEQVEKWVEEAIKRKDIVRVITDPNKTQNVYEQDGSLTVLGLQLLALESNGYGFDAKTNEYINGGRTKFITRETKIRILSPEMFGSNKIRVINTRTTTILGNEEDVAQIIASGNYRKGTNPGGLNALDVSLGIEQMKQWLREAVDRRDIFRVVTDPTISTNTYSNGRLTTLGMQMKLLEEINTENKNVPFYVLQQGEHEYANLAMETNVPTSPTKPVEHYITIPRLDAPLYGGSAIRTMSSKTTTLLGDYENELQMVIESGNYQTGANRGGINILTQQEITPEKMKEWLQKAIERDDLFRIVSDPEKRYKDGRLTTFGQLLQMLENAGYTYDALKHEYVKKQ